MHISMSLYLLYTARIPDTPYEECKTLNVFKVGSTHHVTSTELLLRLCEHLI
jgi:hypothetical protein